MFQESARHAETLDAITKYLDMGTYSEWNEEKKLEFLTRELKGKRPLIPPRIEVISLGIQAIGLSKKFLIILVIYTMIRERSQTTEKD